MKARKLALHGMACVSAGALIAAIQGPPLGDQLLEEMRHQQQNRDAAQ
jgi:hypothetical protein